MAKQAKHQLNSSALDMFRNSRQCPDDNGLIWTTYCEVTCRYGDTYIEDRAEVWIVYHYGNEYVNIQLRGIQLFGQDSNTVFSAKQATISYENETLVVQGKRNGVYYKVLIGKYDSALQRLYSNAIN
ncbi:hypothetical protein [Mucilaginibacter sp.]|uniref:hypothetical protein n=1 Tax=Mucilaginibacter sp. TaxID=1882438 RepID=UPI002847BBD5|nr:hypothetical protein [Mucilaginibacter sp.]MDR3695599.1 hypothetical protein [Mucilaginibacter sp.]